MMAHGVNPVTPQPKAPRSNLWPSPSFSDYFSGDEYSPAPAHANGNGNGNGNGGAKVTPGQQRLLYRLNEIGNQILRSDLSGQTPTHIDAELDALERTLNAPDSQSRAPAELADSGLFVDDEAEEDRREAEENAKAALQAQHDLELREGQAAVQRITDVTEQLQERLREVKHVNDIATMRLQAASDKIFNLQCENEDFHGDLRDIYSSMLLLKMRVRAMEVQASHYIDTPAGRSLRADVERWKLDWRDADARLKDRKHLYERRTSSSASSVLDGNGMSSSMSQSLRITRPGLISRVDSDPFIHDDDDEEEEKEKKEEKVADKNAAKLAAKGKETRSADEGVTASYYQTADTKVPHDSESEQKASPALEKTPWQELWDSLQDYVGIHDYSD